MICSYCRKDPGTKPNGLLKGFRDQDTGQIVCSQCRNLHYMQKGKGEHAGKYSEVPVMAEAPQLTLNFRK